MKIMLSAENFQALVCGESVGVDVNYRHVHMRGEVVLADIGFGVMRAMIDAAERAQGARDAAQTEYR